MWAFEVEGILALRSVGKACQTRSTQSFLMWPSHFAIFKVLHSFFRNARAGIIEEYWKHCFLSKNCLLTAPRPMFKLCVCYIIINPELVSILSDLMSTSRKGRNLMDSLKGVRRMQDTSCRAGAIALVAVLLSSFRITKQLWKWSVIKFLNDCKFFTVKEI